MKAPFRKQWKTLENDTSKRHFKTRHQQGFIVYIRLQLLNRANIMLWKEFNKHAIASKTVTSTNNDLSFSLTQRQEPQMKWEEHIYIYMLYVYINMYIYIYVHIFVHIHTYIYVYIASSRLLELPKPELGW